MIEAVFISDLHLHPNDAELFQRFQRFLDWAKTHTHSIYILGDFLHVYAGDDLIDAFHLEVAQALKSVTAFGVKIYLMPGNRDFLIGPQFENLAGVNLIPDPSVICLNLARIYLTHGDRYCLNDWPHQCLRMLTRPSLCRWILLQLPKKLRLMLVQGVRNYSQHKKTKPRPNRFQIFAGPLYQKMRQMGVSTAIYGHVHQQTIIEERYHFAPYRRFVLADWDKIPEVLCYTPETGLFFYDFTL